MLTELEKLITCQSAPHRLVNYVGQLRPPRGGIVLCNVYLSPDLVHYGVLGQLGCNSKLK